MPAFTRIFSVEQEEAVATAYVDRAVRPMRHVLELAARGELSEGLPAFEVNERTARGWVTDLRRRRAGKIASEKIKDLTPADAMEAIKLRLIASADEGMAAQERLKPDKRDWEVHRQIARAIREAAAIPARGERGNRPGDRSPDTGKMDNGGRTEGGIGGAILAAARMGVTRSGPHKQTAQAQSEEAQRAQHATHTTTEQSEHGHGGEASERAGASSQGGVVLGA